MLDSANPDRPLDGLCQAIIETSSLLYCVIDASSVIVYANPAAEPLLGYAPDELVGRAATELLDSADLDTALAALFQIVDHGHGEPGQVPPMAMRVRRKDGGTTVLDVGAVDQLDNPEVGGIIIRGRPMNGQQLLDQALESLVASSPLGEVLDFLEAALAADLPGSRVAIAHDWDGSAFTASVDGRLPAVLSGVGPDGAAAEPALDGSLPWIEAVEQGGLVVHPDLSMLPADVRASAEASELRACWAMPVTVPPEDATPACIIVWREVAGEPWVSQRVSLERTAHLTGLALARLHHERQLRHAAMHDGLTGVPNRATFFAHLEQVTAEPDRRSAVLYLDLDGFKQVNDSHGHAVGDELLKIVTQRISASVRPDDLVARLGGDEFAVVCADLAEPGEAEAIADRLVEAMAEPAVIDGHEVRVGLSVGVALADRAGDTVAKLVEAADGALYEAKQAGKGRYRVAR